MPPSLPSPKKRGPAKGTGGRPKGPTKAKLPTLYVLPETLAWLQSHKPIGTFLDSLKP